jgi:hypothetical protein
MAALPSDRMLRLILPTLLLIASCTSAQKSVEQQYRCYWMENASGRYEWVPAETGGLYEGGGIERCRALDSCDGGGRESRGGCYKWATSPQGERSKWP